MIDTLSIRSAYRGKTLPETTIQILCDEIDRLRGEPIIKQPQIDTILSALRGEQQTPPLDESVLTSMCMTYRHDFGLLSVKDREPIIKLLRPIYEHHVKPLLHLNPKVTPPQRKTVDVRVAVAVSSNGEWNAAGWHDGKRDVVVETAMDTASFPANVYWLTATLPVPAEGTVVAKVEGE